MAETKQKIEIYYSFIKDSKKNTPKAVMIF